MRLLTSLYLADHRARVQLQHAALLVTNGDGTRTRVPLEALEAVVLLGHAQVTSDVLAECARRHVRVAALTRTGRLRFSVGGPIGGSVHLRVGQLRALDAEERRRSIAQNVVAAKLQNSRRLLQRWASDGSGTERRHLQAIAEMIAARLPAVGSADGDRLRGIEGDAARLYFSGLGHHLVAAGVDLPFLARTRRPPRDPVNALLSFTYGLVTTEIVGALETVGLDPQIGYLHALRAGRPALALDLLEELRLAVADRFVVRVLTRRQIGADDFVRGAGGACYLHDRGRKRLLEAYESFKGEDVAHLLVNRRVPRALVPHVQAVLLARHLRGDLQAYPPFLMTI